MRAEMVTTTQRSLLPAVHRVFEESTTVFLNVAFVAEAGVHLVSKQLRNTTHGGEVRMLVTTTFGTTSPVALDTAFSLGAVVKTINPRGGTYHPKLYIGRRNTTAIAVVGSANLTGGLVSNVEVATILTGDISEEPLAQLWDWAGKQWDNANAVVWRPDDQSVTQFTAFTPQLLSLIQNEVQRNPRFTTLGTSAPNTVTAISESGIYVETDRSRAKREQAQLIPAWMFELAWETLVARGELTNADLLNELRVHRSSAVCAMLARLPGVSVASTRPIRLVHAAIQ